jgi:O-acetylserine/cysteine efflux transporter
MSKKDLFLAIFIAWIWGSNYSVIELGLNNFDPFMLTALRFTMSVIPLCFFIKKPNVNFMYVAIYGIIFGVGVWGVVNFAMFLGVSAGVSSVLLQLSAFFTIFLSSVVFKEKIYAIQYLGMMIALVGVALIVIVINKGSSIGIFLIIIAALCWSICNIIIKKCQPQQLMSFIVWSGIFSAIPLFFIAYLTNGTDIFLALPSSLNKQVIFSICFQAYITTLFGYWVWNMLIKKYKVATVAPISLLIPIFGILTSYYTFNEQISITKIIATCLIILGVFTLMYGEKLSSQIVSIFKKN